MRRRIVLASSAGAVTAVATAVALIVSTGPMAGPARETGSIIAAGGQSGRR